MKRGGGRNPLGWLEQEMSKTIDARGLSCPAPVLMTKEAVEEQHLDGVEVLVDNGSARENVCRFLGARQFSVVVVPQGDDFKVRARRQAGAPNTVQEREINCQADTGRKSKILALLATDRLGFGDDELGRKLMASFIKTLKEMGDDLWRLVLLNNGVKLATETSPVLEDLLSYEREGLNI
jgi:selenium metabolism protein YedF